MKKLVAIALLGFLVFTVEGQLSRKQKHDWSTDTLLVDSSNHRVVVSDTVMADTVAAIGGDGLWLQDDGGNGIFVEDGGQVGIGTANPGELLSLQSSSDADIRTTIASNSEITSIVCQKANGSIGSESIVSNGSGTGEFLTQGYDGTQYVTAGAIAIVVDGTPGTNDMPGRISFQTTTDGAASPTQKMVIKNNGEVGIGETGPEGQLHITTGSAGSVTADSDANELVTEASGNGGISIYTPDANYGRLVFGSPSDPYGGGVTYNHDDGPLITFGSYKATGQARISTGNGVEAVRIDASGNVGIDTTTPDEKLHVNGDVHVEDTLKLGYMLTPRSTFTCTLTNDGTNDSAFGDVVYFTNDSMVTIHFDSLTMGAMSSTCGWVRVQGMPAAIAPSSGTQVCGWGMVFDDTRSSSYKGWLSSFVSIVVNSTMTLQFTRYDDGNFGGAGKKVGFVGTTVTYHLRQ